MKVGQLLREEKNILARGDTDGEENRRLVGPGCDELGVVVRLAPGLQAGGEACHQDGAFLDVPVNKPVELEVPRTSWWRCQLSPWTRSLGSRLHGRFKCGHHPCLCGTSRGTEGAPRWEKRKGDESG